MGKFTDKFLDFMKLTEEDESESKSEDGAYGIGFGLCLILTGRKK